MGIFQIEESEGLLTIEVYLRPDLTGKGLGETLPILSDLAAKD